LLAVQKSEIVWKSAAQQLPPSPSSVQQKLITSQQDKQQQKLYLILCSNSVKLGAWLIGF
jgi:hypothetical protein